jgi:3-hydroxyisobutyrate dehydrogenase-like beta-hydroxyacid dehydrogenase
VEIGTPASVPGAGGRLDLRHEHDELGCHSDRPRADGHRTGQGVLRAGHRTTVWNRSPGKAEAVTADGAVLAASVGGAVTAGTLVVVCVRDYDVVRELLGPVADRLSGRTLVNLTSGSSHEARELAGWAAEHGAGYLDGAIMMTPPGIGAPDTQILYGGPPGVFEAHAPVLRVLGGKTTHLSADPGIPSLYDAALLGLMWSSLNGFLHGLALVGTEGVTATEFLPYATAWLRGVGSFMPGIAGQVDEDSYPGDEATLHTQLPPARHLVHESRIRGIDTTVPRLTERMIERALAEGHATDSYARLIDQMRKPGAGPGRSPSSAAPAGPGGGSPST